MELGGNLTVGRSGTHNRMNIPKSSPVFELLGSLEEWTACLGLAAKTVPSSLAEPLGSLRRDAALLREEFAGGKRFADAGQTAALKSAAQAITASLPQSAAGGTDSQASLALELTRTLARRCERKAVACSQIGGVTKEAIGWLNEASGFLKALIPLAALAGANSGAQSASPVSGGKALRQAESLCHKVLGKAREQGVRAVTAVCDKGGNLLCLLRDDDAFIASIDVAVNKAFTSASLKMSTEQLSALAQPGGELYGIQFTNQGKIVVFGGGVPLYCGDELIGAFGVSGGTAEQDTMLARYAQEIFRKE